MKRERIIALVWKDSRELLDNQAYIKNLIVMSMLTGLVIPLVLYLGMQDYIPFTSLTVKGAQSLPWGIIPTEYLDDLARMTAYYTLQYIGPLIILIFQTQLSTMATIDIYVGEKDRRTFERLLSLPIIDSEIIIGKMVTPFIFSLFGATIVTGSFLLASFLFTSIYPAEHWAVFIIILMPCSILYSVSCTLALIIRGLQYREALQYASFISVSPILILLLLQSFGNLILDTKTFVIISLLFTLVSLFAIIIIFNRFDREKIIAER